MSHNDQKHRPGHQHDRHGHGHQHVADDAGLAEMVELDAEVLSAYLDEVMSLIFAAATDPTRRMVDLGSGTGTGAFALQRRFAGAEVMAVDASPAMLERVRAKALDLRLRNAVRTIQADLDHGWPAVGPVDLIWASASMHHMAEPDRVLRDAFGALRPGGLLAVAELSSFPRFLPAELGDGFEARLHAVLDEARARDLPHIGDDWGTRLRAAGFAVELERVFEIDLPAPLPEAAGRYAQAALGRARTGLEGRISDADMAVFDSLLAENGPQSVLHRDDLRVRTTRKLFLARRP